MGLTSPRRHSVIPAFVGFVVVPVVAAALGVVTGCTTDEPRSVGSSSLPPGSAPALAPALAEPTAVQLASVDIGFAVDMLDHHDQIVELATFVAAHAQAEMVRSLAIAIIGSQQYEKGLLESYLRARGVRRPAAGRSAMTWMGPGVPVEQMPGYLAKVDVIALYNLSGAALDARFLELTVIHHDGGVHMATEARRRASDPWLRDLASGMVVAQQEERTDAAAALDSAR